jgi:D-alanyl-lipoteichoic acid acyltransferase DltB (MBOAT superfamily)
MPDYLRPSVQLGVLILGGYIWFFAYSLQDRLAPGADSVTHQVGTWAPFWTNAAGAGTPLCKGAAYLRRIEAKNPEELAVTQLKGLQLLLWCVLLKIIWAAGHLWAFGTSGWGLDIPDLDAVIASKQLPAWYLCWASLVAGFADTMLSMAVWGNTIVACCRMAGFRALRNTYRPLESTSIADFWNRYYYYFKELLVDFFFYPAYTRYFKAHRKLRLFAATLAAATIGNMLYHFFRDIDLVWKVGLWKAIVGFRVYAFYTLLLGCGIGISQLRGRKPRTDGGFLRTRIQPALAVLSFFCLVHIFDYTGRDHTITQHARFLLHLFNF